MQGIVELHGGRLVVNVDSVIYPTSNFIPGDIVEIADGKTSLVKRQAQGALGILQSENEFSLLIPKTPFTQTVEIKGNKGDRIILWLSEDGSISVKGHYTNSETDHIAAMLALYKLVKEVDTLNLEIQSNHYTRQDVVCHDDLNTFTIDPEHSVDFDDAISVDGTTVYIHIVDIANQIISDESEKRLRERCLTLYSPELNEHLLTYEEASTNLSLIVGQQRKVITVKVRLTDGLVDDYEIYRSTIVVKRRWNYDEILSCNLPDIIYLANLARNRSSEVKYNINLPSLRLTVDKGIATDIRTESTNDISHSLVATAMVLANLVISTHLCKRGIQLPNRFHDSIRGCNYTQTTGNEHVDSFVLVKRFARAFYAVDQKGHFGLGLTNYVHFTSPMRRYADVIVHRLLAGYKYPNLEEEVQRINQRSVLLKSIQTVYNSWITGRWLLEHPDQEVWITGIKPSGLLWYMPALSTNGFAHVSTLLPKQFWKFVDYTLVGGNISISEKVPYKCKVIHVDPITFDVKVQIDAS